MYKKILYPMGYDVRCWNKNIVKKNDQCILGTYSNINRRKVVTTNQSGTPGLYIIAPIFYINVRNDIIISCVHVFCEHLNI